jgi:hypothetical protein
MWDQPPLCIGDCGGALAGQLAFQRAGGAGAEPTSAAHPRAHRLQGLSRLLHLAGALLSVESSAMAELGCLALLLQARAAS